MTGIIIGRFQVPYLHPGHLHLIATSLRECDETVILLGTPPHKAEIDPRNPFGVPHRVRMIKRIFPQIHIQVVHDVPNDQDWSDGIDEFAGQYANPILYHSRDSFKNHYKGRIPTKEVDELPGFSGTELRKSTSYE